jgi:ADP-ribose pyrophosphatase YjhB (NUDIX family)
MTPAATARLLHHLVAASHAEGITALGVEAAIEHDDRVLLIAEPGPDFTDDTWQLPGGPVLPGQTLTDALHPAVAAIGLTIDEITGYLGHHDHPGDQAATRVFRFTVTVTDPGAICRHAGTGHHWAEDLDGTPGYPAGVPGPVSTPAAGEPQLAAQLRAWAHGIYPDEAGLELLIGHAVFLDRTDFTSRFITIPGNGAGLAAIDWPAAIAALDDSLPCSAVLTELTTGG